MARFRRSAGRQPKLPHFASRVSNRQVLVCSSFSQPAAQHKTDRILNVHKADLTDPDHPHHDEGLLPASNDYFSEDDVEEDLCIRHPSVFENGALSDKLYNS